MQPLLDVGQLDVEDAKADRAAADLLRERVTGETHRRR
jgi:hypothetical protein